MIRYIAICATLCATTFVPPARAQSSADRQLFMDAARAAWRFADRNYIPATGLIRPFDTYGIGTMWDIASGLSALFSAYELGFIEKAEYDRRMKTALSTLKRIPLFNETGFNKEYVLDSGRMIGLQRTASARGFGISATDTGRFLLWLRIIANNHPQHAADANAIVRRIRFPDLLDDGYLHGMQLSRRTGKVRTFQEGRIGYEQYAARGYDVWGLAVQNALDHTRNAKEIEISGQVLPADKRGNDRLTSEPFVLLGIEAGWSAPFRQVAERILKAQEARYRRTRILTIVSEDAINIPPDYFFYYTVYSKHGPWTLDVQRPGAKVTRPRWRSTKGAFAWHALLPSAYTKMAVDTIRARAMVGNVWGSGVFEDGRATANPNINTAAVVMAAAVYHLRGTPLLRPAPRTVGAAKRVGQ